MTVTGSSIRRGVTSSGSHWTALTLAERRHGRAVQPNPYRGRGRKVSIGEHAVLPIFGRAAQKPFGTAAPSGGGAGSPPGASEEGPQEERSRHAQGGVGLQWPEERPGRLWR